ncbi:MAG: endonuclease MutS2 [Chloroflexi bacterium]|nr:endonuclease MutS2 [Chloroflexota bacterium]
MLAVLEFPKILQRLADLTAFAASRELALALRPSVDRAVVEHELGITAEARRLFDLKASATVGGARDVRPPAQRAALGGILLPEDFLDILSTLQAGRGLRNLVTRFAEELPRLADIAQTIVDCPSLEQEIARCFSDRGEILDHASGTLARIRGELKVAHQRLTEALHNLMNSPTFRPLVQDAIVTIREGRYVIPIKVEAKSQVRGIIHDQSASGATVYIEPLQIVEQNNRWRQLQLDEQQEVERILRELSSQVGALAATLVTNVEALALLDLALAKARLAGAQRAVEPLLATGDRGADGCCRLVRARHPLLGDNCVPITVGLGADYDVLVITGPNTGGKTVALKTVGLLTLMAQAGLHVPADEGSQVRVFQGVYADIGDEQSIEQSLSTFSSHMTRIVGILAEASDDSLVLLDEIGAGTDPAEGSALARSILGYFLEGGLWAIVTTHYNELKAFAHNTPRVENASVEFDSETLAPTYRLIVGLPGRSNALAIAQRLGLPRPLVEQAASLLNAADVQVEGLLAGIQEEREKASAERAVAESEHRRVVMLRKQLERRLTEVDAERQAAVERAYEEAAAELAALRGRLRQVALSLERSPEQPIQGPALTPVVAPAYRELREVEKLLVERRPRPRRSEPSPAVEPERPLQPGDVVLIRSLNQSGELVTLVPERGTAEVRVGNFKLRANLADLVRTRAQSPGRNERATEPASSGPAALLNLVDRPTPATQLDMRGWRADEVHAELDRYLNDAYLAGLPWVRIVHGKGTGVLRQVVRELLADHALVRSHQPAPSNEGGEGATVVTLAH